MKTAIEISLNEDLPESYDVDSFKSRTDLLLNHFIDMAVQYYWWINKKLLENNHLRENL